MPTTRASTAPLFPTVARRGSVRSVSPSTCGRTPPGSATKVLRYWLGLDIGHNGIPHRALFDATVTAHILGAAIRQVREEGVSDPVKHLLELTERPALLRTVPFGKHRGELWRDVPRDYIDWVLRKQFDDPDVVHTARAAAQGQFAGGEGARE